MKTEDSQSVTVQEKSNRRLIAGHEGGNFVSAPHFGKIAKLVLKSLFCAISSDFYDFTRFQPDFTHFRFFQAIQHVMHVLTRKIIRFYESKHDFNNIEPVYNMLVFFLIFLLSVDCLCILINLSKF